MFSIIIIMLAAGTMLALAIAAGWALGWANRKFHVPTDARQELLIKALPGANCGGCGYVGCSEYAAALLRGEACTKCTVGGTTCAAALANILGVDVKESWPFRPAVHCGARTGDRLGRTEYHGEPTCAAANLVGGVQGCVFGCLGMGDCERSCPFDAIHVLDGLATVDYKKCTGCGACARACPRNIISMVPFKSERMLVVACCNKDFGKDVRAVCKVGCLGCGACSRMSKMFAMIDNMSTISYDDYSPDSGDLQAAAAKCPQKRLVFIGKPSQRDLAAVTDEDLPEVAPDKFETTVDKTDWQG